MIVEFDPNFRPVDLLSDAKGVYGIGRINNKKESLILRPDILKDSAVFPNAVRRTFLHTLNKHFVTRWNRPYEWILHNFMVEQALERNPRFQEIEADDGPLVGGQTDHPAWKAAWKLRNKIKWGQSKRQLILLNGKLKHLIATAADPDALKMARRFNPIVRENVYRASAISSRALQLIDVFPVLGIYIYSPPSNCDHWNKAPDAIKMVEDGDRLNYIAAFMDVPMWARKLKPAVAHLFGHIPYYDLLCYLPDKTWEQRLWLRSFVSLSRRNIDPDFAYWIARNVLKIGNRIRPVLTFLGDMNDWVMEAKREQPRCVTHPFSPDMSVETVRTENELWHEAIAKCDTAMSDYKIPAPWYPAGQVNGYRIVPLDSAEELWKEGRAMHHCAGSYDYRMAAGNCYLYSVRQGEKRVATVELVKEEGKVKPVQIRAACNAEPPKEVKVAVRKWISELKAA